MIYELGSETLTITNRVPLLDGGGNPVRDDYGIAQTHDVATDVEGCAFELVESTERESNVDRTEVVGDAGLPWGTAISATSKITWPAMPEVEFEIQGPLRPWTDFEGNGDHIEVTVRGRRG